MNTNRSLYDALSNVVKNGDIVETTDMDTHVSNLFLFDFEQCGINLPEEERRQVVELNDRILVVRKKKLPFAYYQSLMVTMFRS